MPVENRFFDEISAEKTDFLFPGFNWFGNEPISMGITMSFFFFFNYYSYCMN